jgi:glyoxylase-like metal-dependent hydrolase (beta-lactamase superfamily II)
MTPKGLEIGAVRVDAVAEMSGFRWVAETLFPEAAPEAVDRHIGWMAPDLFDPETRMLAMIRQCFVLRTPRRTIMIDSCTGDDKPRNGPTFNMLRTPWRENFAALGLSYEDIDIVMCTHLHADHVGWNTRLDNGRWVPTFPNARYLFGRTEYEHRLAEMVRAPDPVGSFMEDSVLPVVEAGQAEIVDDAYQLSDNVWFEPTFGHTPGHLCVHVRDGGEEAVFSGDVMHHPIQVREPQWSSCFCEDRDASRRARLAFLDRYADSGALIVPTHFERGSAGRLTGGADGFHFDFLQGGSTRTG